MTKESKDMLGDRMKSLEAVEAARRCMPLLPICVRLDGKGFSKWTKGLRRPYDERLSNLMIATTKYLVEESNARIGYTQSDEISLILYSDSYDSEVFFDGKIQKLTSVLASMATAYFNHAVARSELVMDILDGSWRGGLAIFDCRVWTVPTQTEAVNTLVWREVDATKNSVQMAAREHYSHKELDGKGRADQLEMLERKGVCWHEFPAFFKRGTYIQRKRVTERLSDEAWLRIPEKHRPPRDQLVERSQVVELDMPPITKVVNRVEVVFDGEDPLQQWEIED